MTQPEFRLGYWPEHQTRPLSASSGYFSTVFILSLSWRNLSVPNVARWSQKLKMLTFIPTWQLGETHLDRTVTWRLHPLRMNNGYPDHIHVVLLNMSKGENIHRSIIRNHLSLSPRRWGESEGKRRQESNVSFLQEKLYNYRDRGVMGES